MEEPKGFWDRYFCGWWERFVVGVIGLIITLAIVSVYIFLSPSPPPAENSITVKVNNLTDTGVNVTVKIVSNQLGTKNHTMLNLGQKYIKEHGSATYRGSVDAFNWPAQIQVIYGDNLITQNFTINKVPQYFEFNITKW